MKQSKPSDFRKHLEPAARRHDTRRVFDAFTKFAACALSCETREEEYMEEVKRWEKDELESFSKALGALVIEMQDKPYEDVLGAYYMEFALSSKGQQWNGEFHTPKPICDMMAQMLVGEPPPGDGVITVQEPACGAGAMILSVYAAYPKEHRRRLRFTAIDINKTACDMCYINTTLWGVPCRVLHGNTISMEMWHQWDNIHYVMPWLPLLLQPVRPEQQPDEPTIPIVPVADIELPPPPIGQLELIPA